MTHSLLQYIRPLTAAALMLPMACCHMSASEPVPPAAQVVSPEIPDTVTICGTPVDLDYADYYERFDRELTSLAFTHSTTMLIIKRANRYFPRLVAELRRNGIPDDLLYLACVESSLNPRAVSGAKAAGIWQFMPATAKEFGLEVSDEVDERLDIEKSTAAAARYFKRGLSRYGGDWPSVMASYNAGMARVGTQLERQGEESALDLQLPDETMRYIFRILAMKAVLEDPAKYGFALNADQLYHPREVTIEEVSGPVESWADWARDHGINYRILRDENPWITAPKLTNKNGKTYKVRVPVKETLRRSTASHPVYNSAWTRK